MHPGKIIQNYKVSHLLGSGGMGEVWAGTHLYMNRKVAIKSLHARLATNPEIRRRFKQEAFTMSQLQHPNIVRLYDFIEEVDGVYLVMEFVEGDPLDEYILRKSGPIPEQQALQMFGEILEGMHYAHMQGVIHRDIKPGNFMVTKEGHLKILDFGIAKLLEGAQQHTKTGARIGTTLYMSPEQVQGQPLDLRTDVYSLGVTLFQMVTGRSPYPADTTEYDIFQRILQSPLPRAVDFYPAVSDRVQALIDKATAKAPGARFQDCRLFLDAILFPDAVPLAKSRNHVGQAPSQVMPSANRNRSRRRWLGWVLGILLVGALAAVGYFWVWPEIQKRDPKFVAFEFLTAVEEGDTTQAILHSSEVCQASVLSFFANYTVRMHRHVKIGRWDQTGEDQATVYYHFQEDPQEKSLPMVRVGGHWKVGCTKQNLLDSYPYPE